MIFPAKTKDGRLSVNDKLAFEAHLKDIGKRIGLYVAY